jgi:hypothetical protein
MPVTQALSVITSAELFAFQLCSCNINCTSADTKEHCSKELKELYYICLGKHSIFILDRKMRAHQRLGGVLVRIPYACVTGVHFSDISSTEILRLDIEHFATGSQPSRGVPGVQGDGTTKPRVIPRKLFCRSSERDVLLTKLRTCWKADHMFQHWNVAALPEYRVEDQLKTMAPKHMIRMAEKVLSSETLSNLADLQKLSSQEYSQALIESLVRPLLEIDNPNKGGFSELPDAWQGDTTGNAQDFTIQPLHMTKFIHEKYSFFCPKTFQKSKEQTNCFKEKQGGQRDRTKDYFYMHVKTARALNEPQMTLKEVVDAVVQHEIMPHIVSYQRVGAPREYYKKMNLTGDPASWEAWETHLRAGPARTGGASSDKISERDIGIIAVRRKYIPPVMDTSQVIVVSYYGGKEKWLNTRTFMETPERIVDSLTAMSLCHVPDTLVIQTKADALLLDEDGYAWFHKRLNIRPRAMRMAKQFCAVIIRLLANTGVGDSLDQVLSELGPDIELPADLEDPFVIALRLEKASRGLPSDAPASRFLDWKRRVWRFLAYCVDGGVAPKSLKIETLVYQHSALVGYKRTQNMIGTLIETLLYLHAPGTEHQNGITLKAKLQNPRLMSNFTYNERVMIRLLEYGYIRKHLSVNEDQSQYPRFLLRLMRRKAGHQDVWHTRVRYTVGKELVTMSMAQAKQRTSNSHHLGSLQAADDVAVNMLVPIISRLLHETDENLQVLAVCALVNYTHNNTPMKNTVMASGAVRKVATFLSSHNEDLVRHSCALLRNCTKTPQYRQTVASYGVMRRLFGLLEESEAPPKFRPLPILVQAIAILGQLAYDHDIKQKITETLGFQPMAYTRSQTECPKVILVLQKFLRPDQELGNQPVTDTRREALYFHVGHLFLLFFLMPPSQR